MWGVCRKTMFAMALLGASSTLAAAPARFDEFRYSGEDAAQPALGPDEFRNPILSGYYPCLLYTSPSPRDKRQSRMPSSA